MNTWRELKCLTNRLCLGLKWSIRTCKQNLTLIKKKKSTVYKWKQWSSLVWGFWVKPKTKLWQHMSKMDFSIEIGGGSIIGEDQTINFFG